ncbi:MAG: hypothetical protein KGL95_12230, partial [Patescibacteria group bacterium]|nr:hypothetical protein [Patescibacteria group bacterium]
FVAVFCVVGFGPRLLFSNTTNFFHTSRFALEQHVETNVPLTPHDTQLIANHYVQSLLVWFSEPTTSVFFHYAHPLLPPLLAVLFAIGIGYALVALYRPFFYVLLFLGVSIPFFSSAITNTVNQDHRIITLLPIGSIFAGIGIAFVVKQLRFRYVQYCFMLIICLYLFIQTVSFFLLRPADKMYTISDYLSMHIVNLIKSQNKVTGMPSTICLNVSSDNSLLYHLPHYREQYQYFLSSYIINIQSKPEIPDNEAYVFFGACPVNYLQTTQQQVTICRLDSFDLSCPLDYQGKIILHY